MTSVVDPKAYWDLLETVWWIRSRDEAWVANMQDKSEEDKAALALFGLKPEAKLLPRLSLPEAEFNAAMQMVSACPAEPTLLDQTLDDLFKKASSGQVRMTAIRFGRSSDGQIPVPLAELNGLMFRIATGNRVRTGLWSRSHDLLVWGSPQFLRADAIRAFPARNKKTAATTHAMLRHLRQFMTPEEPLTKLEAQQRCMAEVPHAYPEAFKKAWAQLEPSRKRARGKHGRRAH
jgi:hypothetical protein